MMPDGSFVTRTETLRKYVVSSYADRRMMDENSAEVVRVLESDMRLRLTRDIAKAGRQVHGEVTLDRHEDHLRDAVVFRASCLTRERTDGEWPAIWAAYHEDFS